MVLFCKGCGEQLRKFRGGKRSGKWVIAKYKNGKWVEVKNQKLDEGVAKDKKFFFKCLSCNFLNELPGRKMPEAN